DLPWDEYFRDMDLDSSYYTPVRSREAAELQPTVENCAGLSGSMQEDLCAQLRMLNLSPQQFTVAAYLAGNLDHNGYLQGELEDLTEVIGAELDETEEALKVIQKLEPAGIGCRNLQECLLLQLQRLDNPPHLAIEIVNNYLPAAADGRYRFLTSRLGCTEEAIKEAVEFIRTLNPKPGSIFGEGEETRYIVPDITVEKIDGQYLVTANDGRIPQLTISPFYQKILRDDASDEQLSSFIKTKIEKACWLIRSIEQRRITLFKVAQEIVQIQEAFLEQGIKNLKPLTLKEVATNIGVHESTVSRATAGKYIQTPRGLFPLKFFFSSGLAGAGGVDYSSHSIKTYLRELIDAENPEKPFSDQHLAELLQVKGINISRRTVAKYREEIALPASYKRRRS
ncbi:MAG: RNA polymerase factor sigma-54, partial [Firmicutes bacterium]|nr:RNA polymerase factor sigma-54 [Bacillota bacterium]